MNLREVFASEVPLMDCEKAICQKGVFADQRVEETFQIWKAGRTSALLEMRVKLSGIAALYPGSESCDVLLNTAREMARELLEEINHGREFSD